MKIMKEFMNEMHDFQIPCNKLCINLTWSACTEKYRTKVFLYKHLGLMFLCTDLALG